MLLCELLVELWGRTGGRGARDNTQLKGYMGQEGYVRQEGYVV